MTDKEKLEAIRAEIKKELSFCSKGNLFDEGRCTELHHLKLFIDSLPEKPVSKDLEDEIAKFNNNYFPETDNGLNIEMRKELRTIVGNAIKNGARWKEQQMMKDAIEREVKVDAGGYPYIDATELYDYDNDKPLAKAGDMVKVIIIKQE